MLFFVHSFFRLRRNTSSSNMNLKVADKYMEDRASDPVFSLQVKRQTDI